MEAPTQRATRDARADHTSQDALQLLVETGLTLARERNVDTTVQSALDAGRTLCSAEWGAFFYTELAADGAPCPLFKLTGSAAGSPSDFPLASVDHRLIETIFGDGLVRCADISQDAHFGPHTPFAPLTHGALPARSYFAVPVRSASGALLGGMLFCDPRINLFRVEQEALLETLAAQAAIAIENTRLYEQLGRETAVADSTRQLRRDKAETDRRLRQALDAAQLGTWTWDRATDLVDMDERAAELYQCEPHTPVTRSFVRNRLVLEEDQDITLSSLRNSIETGSAYRAEYRINGVGGTEHWLSVSGIPTFAPDSTEVIGMVGTVQDVTPRKAQEASLRQSEKLAATGRLAATIAHEINNPLEAVTNLIYLLKTDPAMPSFAQTLLETADQELERVAQIAQQTLGFYRDTSRPTNIDLGELIRGVVTLFQRKLSYKKIDISLDLPAGLHIYGLQGELRQVFSNLIVNAIDASFQGRITIRGRKVICSGIEGVSILVCDQGTGIPVSARRHLFEPFFTTKVEIGTGLGLWVTRGIVEKQGGSVRFRTNTMLPSGTIFRVFLRSTMQISIPESSQSKFLQ